MNDSRPPEQLLRITKVQDRTGLSRASVWRLVRDASFPAPVRIGRRAVAWLDTEIDSWIANCVKARNTSSVWGSEPPRTTSEPIYPRSTPPARTHEAPRIFEHRRVREGEALVGKRDGTLSPSCRPRRDC